MLPRRPLQRAHLGFLALVLCVGVSSLQAPVQAYRSYTPPVENAQIAVRAISTQQVSSGMRTILAQPRTTDVFTLVGVTWRGQIDSTSKFEVRIHENGAWTNWIALPWSDEHGADGDSAEARNSLSGTDPLFTAPSNGIALRVTNKSGTVPTDISMSLVNSSITKQDRSLISTRNAATTVPSSVTSPQGAVVARPNLITRAQWGADESWRNQDPGMGTKIIAGFLHHTASSNGYSASQGPAQMRSLYSYYTHSLHYKDLAYSFLIDLYGNVYEGRSGCPRVVTTACDGPSRPAIGAHTAGMNVNTFAISAIGNFQEASPGSAALAKMDEAIAGLMAWKIAPYGLDPKAIANIPMSSDPHHLSRYKEGDVAHVLTISGHRDVGQTVCPGKFLYPELPAIRDRISQLLTPVLAIPKTMPSVVADGSAAPIAISAVIVKGASWTIDVVNDADKSVVGHAQGSATKTGPVSYKWLHVDDESKLLPLGTYTVRVKQTLPATPTSSATPSITPSRSTSSSATPTRSASATPTRSASATPTPSLSPTNNAVTQRETKVVIAKAPTLKAGATWSYRSKTRAWMTWTPATSLIPVTYQYRLLDKSGTQVWSAWKPAVLKEKKLSIRKLKKAHVYRFQLKAVNSIGESRVVETQFTQNRVK